MKKFFRRIVLRWRLEILKIDYMTMGIHDDISIKMYEEDKRLLSEELDAL